MKKEPDLVLVRLGQAIRKRREELHLTQEQASLRVGIDRPYWTQIETGEKTPSYRVLVRMAEALSIRLKDLLPDEEE